MISKAQDSSAAIKTIAMAVTSPEEKNRTKKPLHRHQAIQRDDAGIQMILIHEMPKRIILLLLNFCVPPNRQAMTTGQNQEFQCTAHL